MLQVRLMITYFVKMRVTYFDVPVFIWERHTTMEPKEAKSNYYQSYIPTY